eukprot:620681-Pelagomonas_calceolata.AAC.1
MSFLGWNGAKFSNYQCSIGNDHDNGIGKGISLNLGARAGAGFCSNGALDPAAPSCLLRRSESPRNRSSP